MGPKKTGKKQTTMKIGLALAFLNAKFSFGERHVGRLLKADPSGPKF
jgi:hypothetical protein